MYISIGPRMKKLFFRILALHPVPGEPVMRAGCSHPKPAAPIPGGDTGSVALWQGGKKATGVVAGFVPSQ